MSHCEQVFISASGAGYYGRNLQTPAHETSPPGKDFLAQVCEQWEEKAKEFDKGRLVIIRPGVILSPKGGALKKMLLPFKLGLGGKLGSGKQLISWITIDDLIYQIYRILLSPHIEGPVNLCDPKPISNMEFSKTLATTLFRPCIFSQPSFLVKTIFGEMAENLLLSSIVTFLLLCAICWNIHVFYLYSKLAGQLLFPYLIWVIYAMTLNVSIWLNN